MLRVICDLRYSNPDGVSSGREIRTFDIVAPEVEAFLRSYWPTNSNAPAWAAATATGVEVLQGKPE